MNKAMPPTDGEFCPPICVRRVAEKWLETLVSISPTLSTDDARSRVEDLVASLVLVLRSEPFDSTPAYGVGTRLEGLDSFQPNDLVRAQEGLVRAFGDELRPEVFQRCAAHIFSIAFNLGAGFWAAQQRRAGVFGTEAVSRMGHDLKTPINAITGFSRVILKGIDGPITDFQREDLTSIYEGGVKLLTMINDVFSIRKLDASRTLIHREPFVVSELVGNVYLTMQPLVAAGGHAFTIETSGDLGTMDLDVSMVRWVLLSLLLHEVRRETATVLRLRVERDREAGNWLVFTVSSRAAEVSGEPTLDAFTVDYDWPDPIGLKTCRRFCDAMGGSIVRSVSPLWSSSHEGPTSYLVRLPASK